MESEEKRSGVMSSHLCRLAFTCADGGHVEVDPKATVHIEICAPVCSNFLLCPGSVPEKDVSQHVITQNTLLLHTAGAFEKRLWKYIIGFTL